jgi:hypothetical protein
MREANAHEARERGREIARLPRMAANFRQFHANRRRTAISARATIGLLACGQFILTSI